MPRTPHGYPQTVAEVVDDRMRFRRATLAAVRRLARSRPWRGTRQSRNRKFRRLHARLCRVYGRRTSLSFQNTESDSATSFYSCLAGTIGLRGRLSVVTYLHEFAHALGKDERDACRWSINLFKRCFPRSFANCETDGHMLRRRSG